MLEPGQQRQLFAQGRIESRLVVTEQLSRSFDIQLRDHVHLAELTDRSQHHVGLSLQAGHRLEIGTVVHAVDARLLGGAQCEIPRPLDLSARCVEMCALALQDVLQPGLADRHESEVPLRLVVLFGDARESVSRVRERGR